MRNLQRKHLTRTAAVIAAAALGLGVHLALGFGLDQPVTAAARPAQKATTMAMVTAAPATWTQRTCSAFSTWSKHETAANLSTLVIDATHLGKGYLAADIGELFADASSPSVKAAKYLAKDKIYVGEDCTGL